MIDRDPRIARNPLSSVPELKLGTLRRTMHVDVGPPAAWGASGQELRLDGAGRDVRGESDGEQPLVLREAGINAVFDHTRVLKSLEVRPDSPWAESIVGQRAGGGFRRYIDQVTPKTAETSLVRQLLEDLPGAALISGYSSLRIARRLGGKPGDLTPPGVLSHMTDICSGWRAGGTAAVGIAAGDGVPVQDTPEAPDLTGSDPHGWHRISPLSADWMRRRRLVDVDFEDDGRRANVWAMFRDSVGGDDSSTEFVLHEYALEGTLEMSNEGWILRTVRADPRVLPFWECPLAGPEVVALDGTLLADVSKNLPTHLPGIKSCTHLNDLLRHVGGISSVLPVAS